MGRTKLVFHVLGKMPDESDKLNRYNRGGVIAYLQFFRNTFSIKLGPGLDVFSSTQMTPLSVLLYLHRVCAMKRAASVSDSF